MNLAIAIALVSIACFGRLAVRANIIDQNYYSPHVGAAGHLCGGHGPKYRKISLIGGGGGGGLLHHPTALASIASSASVSVPHLVHGGQRRPALATYCSRSGPGLYGLYHATGDHYRGPTGWLSAKKSTGLGCGDKATGRHQKRLQFVGPTCCKSCGGCGGVHYNC